MLDGLCMMKNESNKKWRKKHIPSTLNFTSFRFRDFCFLYFYYFSFVSFLLFCFLRLFQYFLFSLHDYIRIFFFDFFLFFLFYWWSALIIKNECSFLSEVMKFVRPNLSLLYYHNFFFHFSPLLLSIFFIWSMQRLHLYYNNKKIW